MATTPGGLPYPVGTDKVVDGDDAIRALAEGVDPVTGTPVGATFTPDAALWSADASIPSRLTRAGSRWMLTGFVRNRLAGGFSAGSAALGSVAGPALVPGGPTTTRVAGVVTFATGAPVLVGVQVNAVTGAVTVLFPAAITSQPATTMGVGWEISWDAA